MMIENVYEGKYLLPVECEGNFRQKLALNTIEKIGLEAIAVEFLAQHEEMMTGDGPSAERREAIRGFIRWNESSVDILDGIYDTYDFDGYLFGDLWMTENGIPMLTAYEIPEECEDWTDYDWMCDFPARMFRLN